MIWRRFQRGDSISYSRVVDDEVIEVNGSPVNHPAETGAAYALGEVRLLAPLIPRMLYAASPNCRGHVEGMAARRGSAPSYPWSPEPNFRSVHAGIGPEADIVAPADSSGVVQPEGQPAVALGKRARKVTAACGPGLRLWLCQWQRHQRAGVAEWRPDMFRSKNYDSFKPPAPGLLPAWNAKVSVASSGIMAGFGKTLPWRYHRGGNQRQRAASQLHSGRVKARGGGY